jgi:hypothetical protein
LPKLFADMEEVGEEEAAPTRMESTPLMPQAAEPQAAVQQSAPIASQSNVTPASDDGVVYTYYRGVKTAVNKPPVQNENDVALEVAATNAPDVSAVVPAAPATQVPVQSAAQTPAPTMTDATLLHELEQLRAGMLEMSRRLQEMQQAQQGNMGNAGHDKEQK